MSSQQPSLGVTKCVPSSSTSVARSRGNKHTTSSTKSIIGSLTEIRLRGGVTEADEESNNDHSSSGGDDDSNYSKGSRPSSSSNSSKSNDDEGDNVRDNKDSTSAIDPSSRDARSKSSSSSHSTNGGTSEGPDGTDSSGCKDDDKQHGSSDDEESAYQESNDDDNPKAKRRRTSSSQLRREDGNSGDYWKPEYLEEAVAWINKLKEGSNKADEADFKSKMNENNGIGVNVLRRMLSLLKHESFEGKWKNHKYAPCVTKLEKWLEKEPKKHRRCSLMEVKTLKSILREMKQTNYDRLVKSNLIEMVLGLGQAINTDVISNTRRLEPEQHQQPTEPSPPVIVDRPEQEDAAMSETEAALKMRAWELYDAMLAAARKYEEIKSVLLDEQSEDAAKMRGHLLGTSVATRQELLLGKFMVDCQSDENVWQAVEGDKFLMKDAVAGPEETKEAGSEDKGNDRSDSVRHDRLREYLRNALKASAYTTSDRARFGISADGHMDIKKGVVLAIFGKNQDSRDPRLPSNFSHAKLRQILERCLQLARLERGEVRITKDHASSAYEQVTNTTEQPDLNELTNSDLFRERLKRLLEREYWDGPSPCQSEQNSTKRADDDQWDKLVFAMGDHVDKGHPTVEYKVFDFEKRKIWYIVVRHPFSPSFIRELLRDLDGQLWMYGRSGRKDSWVRVAGDPCHHGHGPDFQISNDLYPCDTCLSPTESKLFRGIRIAFTAIRETVQALNPSVYIPNTLDCNIAQMVLAEPDKARYGAHNDGNYMIHLMQTEKGVIEVQPGKFLPTQDNLTVVTFVVSDDPTPDAVQLVISEKTASGGKKVIGRVPLPNVGVHIQGPLGNHCKLQHEVTKNPDANVVAPFPGCLPFRLVMSLRLSVDPVFNQDRYQELLGKVVKDPRPHNQEQRVQEYSEFGCREVISGIRKGGAIVGSTKQRKRKRDAKENCVERRKATGGPIDLTSALFSDRFQKVELVHYLDLVGEPADSYLRLLGPVVKYLQGPCGTRAMLDLENVDGQRGDRKRQVLQITYDGYSGLSENAGKASTNPASSPNGTEDDPTKLTATLLTASSSANNESGTNRPQAEEDMVADSEAGETSHAAPNVMAANVRVATDAPTTNLAQSTAGGPAGTETAGGSALQNDLHSNEPSSANKPKDSHPQVHPSSTATNMQVLFFVPDDDGNLTMPLPGQVFSSHSILYHARLQHTDRAHPTYVYTVGGVRIVVISQAYKNDEEGILKIIEAVTEWYQNQNDETTLMYQRDEACAYMCGHGGMPKNNGTHAADPKTSSKDDPLISFPWEQVAKQGKTNRNWAVLKGIAEEEIPFALFVNEDLFKDKEDNGELKFLGYFHVVENCTAKMSEKEFQRITRGKSSDFKEKSMFKLSRHFQWKFGSVLGTEDWNVLRQDINEKAGFEAVKIPRDCPYYLETGCSIKRAREHLITPNDVIRQFISERQHERLQVLGNAAESAIGLHRRKRRRLVQQPTLPRDGTERDNDDGDISDGDSFASEDEGTVICMSQTESDNPPTVGTSTNAQKENTVVGQPKDSSVGAKTTKVPDVVTHKGHSGTVMSTINLGTELEDQADIELINTKIEISDIIRVCFVNQYAGALRYLGKSKYNDTTATLLKSRIKARTGGDELPPEKYLKKETAIPLLDDDADFLNQGMQRWCSPMSCRTIDCNVHFLLEEMERRGFKREEGETFPLPSDLEERRTELFETLYSTVIFRVLGRTSAFEHYGKECNDGKTCIPKPAQIGEFLNFVLRTVEGNGQHSNSIKGWITDQHKAQIPSEWHTFSGFKQFATSLEKELGDAFNKHFDQKKGLFVYHESWLEMVKLVDGVLSSLCMKQKTKTRWFAQMIVGDMDEVFPMPFGECLPEYLVPAHGSNTCLVYLQNNGLYRSRKGSSASKNFHEALRDIIAYVENPTLVPDECLVVAGYKRVAVDGGHKVVCLVNGTRFDAKHAEHFMCKMYIQVKYTSSGYRKTLQPDAAKTFCWPLKFHNVRLKCNKELGQICCQSVHQMHVIRDPKKTAENGDVSKMVLTLPPVVIIEGEKSQHPSDSEVP